MTTTTKITTTLLFAVMTLLSMSIATAGPVGPGTCSNSDVTANGVGGPASAIYCINQSGNDGNGIAFSANINSLFNTEHSTTLSGNWSQRAKKEAIGSQSIGTWDFASLAASISNPFIIVLKATNNFAAYLFDFTTSGIGSFDTIGVTDDGKRHDISHISIYTTDSISHVPLPAAIWLFGPVLMGLIGIRKRYTA
ncbi:hypothetical protein A9Q79_05440 [Methylophaga sp. 42_25_T18]|nr:hypothetical protein A9Q79_05440 [Methylophaga sp. 42_25_T18]